MANVTDPNGVQWSVRRKWFSPGLFETGFATLDMIVFVIMLPFLVAWPFWYLAKWLGVPWLVVVKRDGDEVAREHVRGWRRSGQRIEELASQAAAGGLTQYAVES